MTLKARLHLAGGRDGYRYSVLLDGQLLVDRSRDPECDAARALLAKGITGKLTMLDGKTGKPRTIIDIEKAARLTAEETMPLASESTGKGVAAKSTAPKRKQPRGCVVTIGSSPS
jgi:hypothetical protein